MFINEIACNVHCLYGLGCSSSKNLTGEIELIFKLQKSLYIIMTFDVWGKKT